MWKIKLMRTLLCLALCLVMFSSWGCPSDGCIEYQDVALVYSDSDNGIHIDSIVMIANDSIIGCGRSTYKGVGLKTHSVRFPINVRLQLFSLGGLWKELFFEMDKNTVVGIYTEYNCSDPRSSSEFLREVKLSKERNMFIDSSLTVDYCWLLEKMDNSYDYERCTEYAVDGETNLCGRL